jgi:hypothetical protein
MGSTSNVRLQRSRFEAALQRSNTTEEAMSQTSGQRRANSGSDSASPAPLSVLVLVSGGTTAAAR